MVAQEVAWKVVIVLVINIVLVAVREVVNILVWEIVVIRVQVHIMAVAMVWNIKLV